MLHICNTHERWHIHTGPCIWHIIDYLNHMEKKKKFYLAEEKWANTTKMYRTSYDKLTTNRMVKNAFVRGETTKRLGL